MRIVLQELCSQRALQGLPEQDLPLHGRKHGHKSQDVMLQEVLRRALRQVGRMLVGDLFVPEQRFRALAVISLGLVYADPSFPSALKSTLLSGQGPSSLKGGFTFVFEIFRLVGVLRRCKDGFSICSGMQQGWARLPVAGCRLC